MFDWFRLASLMSCSFTLQKNFKSHWWNSTLFWYKKRFYYGKISDIKSHTIAFVSFYRNKNVFVLFRSSHKRYSVKNRCLQKFSKFHKKTPVLEFLLNKVAGLYLCWILFLIKLQAFRPLGRPVTLLKRDSNTGTFLWNFQNF